MKIINYSRERFLLGVTGIPDFRINLWDWNQELLLASVPAALSG
jgi:hypothetical protein